MTVSPKQLAQIRERDARSFVSTKQYVVEGAIDARADRRALLSALDERDREIAALRNLANNLQPGPISEALAGTRYTREAELEQEIAALRKDAERYRVRRREYQYMLNETPEQYDAETDALAKLQRVQKSALSQETRDE